MATRTVVGYEALSRGPVGTPLESPMALLEAARGVERLGELDWLCRTLAMQAASESGLDRGLSWFINVETASLEMECPQHLQATLQHARTNLRVVLEIVERDVHGYVTHLLRAADHARRDAWGVALDDVGADSVSLALLPLLQPDVVKLDMSLIHDGPTAEAAKVTGAVRAYAERTGAHILAEGIETEAHEELASVFGATYGQGYLYGAPTELPRSVPQPRDPIPLRQRPEPMRGETPFEVLNAATPAQRGRTDQLLHIAEHLRSHCTQSDDAGVLLTVFEDEASYQQRKEAYDSLAGQNALTVCLIPDARVRRSFPRYHVGPLTAGSRLGPDITVIVIKANYAGALVTRRRIGDVGDQVDFIYTHDRDAVIMAGRAFLDNMLPTTPGARWQINADARLARYSPV